MDIEETSERTPNPEENDEFTAMKKSILTLIKGKLNREKGHKIIYLREKNFLTHQEAREILGSLAINENKIRHKFRKIGFQTREAERYSKLAEEARVDGNETRENVLKEFEEWCDLEADRLCQELDLPLESEAGQEMLDEVIENNEKVKKFLKENGLALAGVSIMLASFVTAVVSLVKSGARAAKSVGNKVADAFKELAKKLGPILGPIFP